MEAVFVQHKNNPLQHLRGILSLAEVYPQEALVASFALARECNTYSHRFIRGLLESGALSETDTHPWASPDLTEVALPADLAVYQKILEARS
jgi:hypothetical protein